MVAISKLLGADQIVSSMVSALNDPSRRVYRLTGPAGSGKSTIASGIGSSWCAANGSSIIAIGDERNSDRQYFPFLAGLIEVKASWNKIALEGSRSALKVVDVLQGTGGVASSLFDLLGSARKQRADRATRTLNAIEKEILGDIRRLAKGKQLLIIADNLHWWDQASLSLLEQLQSDLLTKSVPELANVNILLVDTAGHQSVADIRFFQRVTRLAELTTETRLSSSEEYGRLLGAFGVSCNLPESLVRRLYAITGGHLKLTEQIVRYLNEQGTAFAFEEGDEIASIIGERIATIGSQDSRLKYCLSIASIMGLTFDIRQLACAMEARTTEVRQLLEKAEKLSLVHDAKESPRFAHDILRSYFLLRQPNDAVRKAKDKLEECVSKLRPGDYGIRARLLLEAGRPDKARELFALHAAHQLRSRQGTTQVIRDTSEAYPNDSHFHEWIVSVAAAYDAIATGKISDGHRAVSSPIPSESPLMGAERNYVAALCAMELQTESGFDEAERLVRTWAKHAENEKELHLRLQLLLQQILVLADRMPEARALEVELEAELISRIKFDQDAADLLQIQNRRSASVHVPEIAQIRIKRSVKHFAAFSQSRPIPLYRSLTNHIGVLTQLGRYQDAAKEAERAEALVIGDRVGDFPRRDVLAHNMILARLRSGDLSIHDAVERQKSVVSSSEGDGDDFLQRCNLAAFELLDGHIDDGGSRIEQLNVELERGRYSETYLVYHAKALEVAANLLSQNYTQARILHEKLDDFISKIRWPTASYVRRRHELWSAEFEGGGLLVPDPEFIDTYFIEKYPMEIGPCWDHHGRLIPCVGLYFWSDS